MSSPSHALDTPASPPLRSALWALWAILLVVGAVGMWQRMTQGHLPAGYGSYAPWGLWIGIYFHGVGLAGGAFALGALGYLLDWPGFRDVRALRATVVLSVACILPALLAVFLDLGRPERSASILLRPNLTSMMAFNAWMYNVFLASAMAAFFLSFRPNSTWMKPALVLGSVLVIMFPSQSGAFFGVVDAKPFWNSALMPLLFLTGAMTAGAGLLLVVRMLVFPQDSMHNNAWLRNAILGGLAVYAVLEFAEFSIHLWNPTSHAPEVSLVLWGPYWWVFWVVHFAAGMVLPALLLVGNDRRLWGVASLLVSTTFIASRLNVLIPGQATADLLGLQSAFQHERLTFVYHATATEYLVGLFLVALGMAVFWIGLQIERRLSRAWSKAEV